MLIRVYARPQRGRWRCGKFWPHSWVEAEATDEQLKALEADPKLVVEPATARNEALPTVGDVQPRPETPEPTPWGDPKLERLRLEATKLDEEAEKKAKRIRGVRNTPEEEANNPDVVKHKAPKTEK